MRVVAAQPRIRIAPMSREANGEVPTIMTMGLRIGRLQSWGEEDTVKEIGRGVKAGN
jgi:hypothetical protein